MHSDFKARLRHSINEAPLLTKSGFLGAAGLVAILFVGYALQPETQFLWPVEVGNRVVCIGMALGLGPIAWLFVRLGKRVGRKRARLAARMGKKLGRRVGFAARLSVALLLMAECGLLSFIVYRWANSRWDRSEEKAFEAKIRGVELEYEWRSRAPNRRLCFVLVDFMYDNRRVERVQVHRSVYARLSRMPDINAALKMRIRAGAFGDPYFTWMDITTDGQR